MSTEGNNAEELALPPSVLNELHVTYGHNSANHTATMRGYSAYVAITNTNVRELRTRQAVYRHAAWLLAAAEAVKLPDETERPHDFETVLAAVKEALRTA